MEEHHHSFRAMNTEIDVSVMAERRPMDAFLSVELLFEQQEQRFSRFREGSLLSRFNRGEPIEDPWFAAAIRLALAMYEETAGLFNPAILPSLRAAGYDRTFEERSGGRPVEGAALPFPGILAIEGDHCRLLAGAVDLGGVVKGWTADLAAEHLRETHADALVNAGGDMRACGSDGAGLGWLVEVDGWGGGAGWSGRITSALATSTTRKRRWITDGGHKAHHLIDPRTGLPGRGQFAQASVIAESCARAEGWAKAIIIGGDEALERATRLGLRVGVWPEDGDLRLPAFEAR